MAAGAKRSKAKWDSEDERKITATWLDSDGNSERIRLQFRLRRGRKGSLLELTDRNTLNTDGWGTMQGDANEHFPHRTTRQDTTNQQQTLQNKQ